MNQKEILQAAQDAQPELVKKAADHLEKLEKLDPVIAQEVASDFNDITAYASKRVAPKVEKVAAKQGAGMSGFGLALGGSLLAGLGTAVATDLYDAARRGLTKGVNFRRIMEANPDLKSYDSKRLRESFNTLHRYGSDLTADPLMGGSLLKALAGLEGNEHTLIRDVIKTRKEFLEAKAKRFSPGHVSILNDDKPSAKAD